jgi:hypothetical protein
MFYFDVRSVLILCLMQDLLFAQLPSPPTHADSDSHLPSILDSSDPLFTMPSELFSATSFPSHNLQAVISLHKVLTQHLSGFGYDPLKQRTTVDFSPPQNTSTSSTATEMPNNEISFPLFCFYNNGSKTIKRTGKQTYYKCSEENCP